MPAHQIHHPDHRSHGLDGDPVARAAYDRLSYGHRREHVLAIENAKKPETRMRRIDKAITMLRDQGQALGRAARVKTPRDHP